MGRPIYHIYLNIILTLIDIDCNSDIDTCSHTNQQAIPHREICTQCKMQIKVHI